MGAALPFVLLPRVHDKFGLDVALWVGAIVQSISFFCLIVYVGCQRYWASYLAAVDRADIVDNKPDTANTASGHTGNGVRAFAGRVKALGLNVWLQIIAVCLIPVTQYVSLGLLPVYLIEGHKL